MKTINFIIALIFTTMLSLSLFSCEKDAAMLDEDIPLIELISPGAGDMFMNGDTIQIHAEISDNDAIHEIHAHITREHIGQLDTVWSTMRHSHMQSFSFYDSYVIETSGMHKNFELTITVSDHNENIGNKTFSFHIM